MVFSGGQPALAQVSLELKVDSITLTAVDARRYGVKRKNVFGDTPVVGDNE